jgi:peptidoglycan hydrolase-like protein with peptidoglycan-binding domain
LAGIQKLLQKLSYDPGKIDGKNGPHTEKAVKAFQKDHGLKVDGIAGPKTQAAMAQALKSTGAGGNAAASGGPPAPPTTPAPLKTPAPPEQPQAGNDALNLGPWQAARQHAITELKTLAKKVAGTKHHHAAGVLKEIQAIIGKLQAKPAHQDLDKLEAFIRDDEMITAAESSPKHFHHLNIRRPLLEALAALKQ